MAKVLFINPNKWCRGITPIWIASHSALLKSKGHKVKLFDATFYNDWMVDEIAYNTANKQYKPSSYSKYIILKSGNILEDLQKCVDEYKPDIIFWSAVSSHIHGEGEYVNIQYGYQLIEKITSDALKITGGIQPTAKSKEMLKLFPNVDYFVGGESEFVLCEIADKCPDKKEMLMTKGITFLDGDEVITNAKQEIIRDMDKITPYDYSVFEDHIFWRPYNGMVERAVDYELSRGCIYACSYCVESVIQKYYGFTDVNNGVIRNARKYLRHKSANRVFNELKELNEKYGITLIRCQDTNFLTIHHGVLTKLAMLLENSGLNIKLYIETRPEGINLKSIKLLKKLKVDGIGMGIEVSTESFRKDSLNRYASQEKIIRAFKLLEKAGIKRTAYNIIGLPGQTEKMIIETIEFNRLIDPDNITVAFYSPYIGTREQEKSHAMKYFADYEYHVDGQLRTMSKSTIVSKDVLEFYKKHFVLFVREGLNKLTKLKNKEGEL